MAADWYLVKHVPDLMRNEPINVGVVVTGDGRARARFVGEREDGTIDGRRVPRIVEGLETFKAWAAFIRREAEAGRLDERIASLARRGGDSFVLERRGAVVGDLAATSIDAAVDQLYCAAVAVEPAAAAPSGLDALAEHVVGRLALPAGRELERSVDYPLTIRGEPIQVHFDYRYVNGKVTLMDKVNLGGHGRRLTQSVNDFLYRIEQVEKQAKVSEFVALYAGHQDDSRQEEQLRLIDKYARTVDLCRDDAADTVGQVLGVPVLS